MRGRTSEHEKGLVIKMKTWTATYETDNSSVK